MIISPVETAQIQTAVTAVAVQLSGKIISQLRADQLVIRILHLLPASVERLPALRPLRHPITGWW